MAAVSLDAAIGADSLSGFTVSRGRGLTGGFLAGSFATPSVSRDRGLDGGFSAGSSVTPSVSRDRGLDGGFLAGSSATPAISRDRGLDGAATAGSSVVLSVSRDRGLDGGFVSDSATVASVSRDRGLGSGIESDSAASGTGFYMNRGFSGDLVAGSESSSELNDNDWITCDVTASSATNFSYLMVRPRPPGRIPPPPRQALRQVPQPIAEPRLTIRLPE